MKKMNTTDFCNKSNIKHNNIYDYSLVNYINNRTKVKIICKEHGIFEQKPPPQHLRHPRSHGRNPVLRSRTGF